MNKLEGVHISQISVGDTYRLGTVLVKREGKNANSI